MAGYSLSSMELSVGCSYVCNVELTAGPSVALTVARTNKHQVVAVLQCRCFLCRYDLHRAADHRSSTSLVVPAEDVMAANAGADAAQVIVKFMRERDFERELQMRRKYLLSPLFVVGLRTNSRQIDAAHGTDYFQVTLHAATP